MVVLLFARGIDSDLPIYGGLFLSIATYIIVSVSSQPGVKLTTAPE